MVYHGVLVLFRTNQKILLIQRGDVKIFPHMVTFPSGNVELNESARKAAVREVKEEVGVSLEEDDLQFVHLMHRRKANGEIWIDFFFACEKWEGDPFINEPEKFNQLGWFEYHNLPDNTLDFVRQAINEINQNNMYSEYGFDLK